jgi:hypothetical protein
VIPPECAALVERLREMQVVRRRRRDGGSEVCILLDRYRGEHEDRLAEAWRRELAALIEFLDAAVVVDAQVIRRALVELRLLARALDQPEPEEAAP